MVHLHLHSHYSTLDGLGKISEIVARAKEIGAGAVAVTDHGSISCMPELFKECEKQGVKPIIGCEFYVVDDPKGDNHENRRHLTVLAKNWNGVQSIMRQLSLANKQFFRRPRLSWEQALDFEDCIVMSACAFGMLSHDDFGAMASDFYGKYKDDFYIEIMPIDFEGQKIINERAVALWKGGFQLVATTDAHYVRKEDATTHEVLIAVQFGQKWDDPERKSFGDDLYMKSRKEMVEQFSKNYPDIPRDALVSALQNTERIAEKIDVIRPETPVELPMPDDSMSDTELFRKRLTEGLRAKLGEVLKDPEKRKEYNERLAYEIEVIKKLGYIRYFLIVEDIIRWSRERGIMVGPARGSSCGSLVCYCMDITQVDPIEHGLLFERFLNPHRHDLPDIDVDFQDDMRIKVFNYIRDKYGDDYTAYINTFGRMTLKSAFRDVCRVMEINIFEVNNLSKMIEPVLKKMVDDDGKEYIEEVCPFEHHAELATFAAKHPFIVEQAKKLNGTIRQFGVHAAGMVVSSRRLDEVCVIEHRRGKVEVTNWDKRECEGFGLLKMDILGLSTLTILNNAKKFIEDNHGDIIEFTDIPLDDPKTLAAFSRGEGIGVFQFENSGMQKLLRDLNASDFETITATTALYRPGSLESGETARFTKIARGEEYETYPHELARPILEPTKGILVYQEQVMKLASDLAGFTLPEADTLRKIIGKKLGKDEFEKHRDHFVEGCEANGVEREAANEIFSKMVEFSGYAFNKSHACAYSVISFWSMYLKQHYPAEFMAAALTSVKSERSSVLVKEAERLGIKTLMPDVNASDGTKFIPAQDGDDWYIRAPLSIIKGVGPAACDTITMAKEKGGVFLSYQDMLDRIDKRRCNIRVQETICRAGACESLGIVEADEQLRQSNFAELLPIYTTLPSLSLDNTRIDDKEMAAFMLATQTCHKASGGDKKLMLPKYYRKSPSIMWVNNHQTNEDEPLTADGTRYGLAALKSRGVAPQNVYYTAPMKCQHGKSKPSKKCESNCVDALLQEIQIVKPKLIICSSSMMVQRLSGEKNTSIGKMANKVVYSKEFECYIIFTYSPQYAFFKDEALESFNEVMDTVAEMFGTAEVEEAA